MDFVTRHFGKMNLLPVEHFYQHICHHFWAGLLGAIANPPKSDDKYVEKSVQLDRGSSFRNALLQNPYFSKECDVTGKTSLRSTNPKKSKSLYSAAPKTIYIQRGTLGPN